MVFALITFRQLFVSLPAPQQPDK